MTLVRVFVGACHIKSWKCHKWPLFGFLSERVTYVTHLNVINCHIPHLLLVWKLCVFTENHMVLSTKNYSKKKMLSKGANNLLPIFLQTESKLLSVCRPWLMSPLYVTITSMRTTTCPSSFHQVISCICCHSGLENWCARCGIHATSRLTSVLMRCCKRWCCAARRNSRLQNKVEKETCFKTTQQNSYSISQNTALWIGLPSDDVVAIVLMWVHCHCAASHLAGS